MITLGAATTAGGKVMSASSACLIKDVAIALEGDLVSCPVCKSTGKILCVGPRIPETWQGRHVALENDLCTCHCSPSPRLLASQTIRSQVLKDTGHALSQAMDTMTMPARRGRMGARRDHAGRFVLLDERTGTPLAHREYAVVRQSGRLEFGTSDASGQTHVLASSPGAQEHEVYDIYL